MSNRVARKLGLSRALLIAIAAIASLTGPIVMGIAKVKAGGAQSEPAVRAVARPIEAGEERPLIPQTAQLRGSQTEPSTTTTEPQTGGERGNPWSSRVMGEYRVGQIRVVGARVLDNDVILPLIGLVSGESYDESRLREGLRKLVQLYGSLGYVNFLPEPAMDFDDLKKIVNLTVNVKEGPQYTVKRISFTGNTTTPDEVIRREILLKEGQVFNVSLLNDSLLRLNQLRLFEEIQFRDFAIRPLPNEPTLNIDLRVQEKGR